MINPFGTDKTLIEVFDIREKDVKWDNFTHLKEAEYETNEYYRGFINPKGELILVKTAYHKRNFHDI